MSFLSISSEVFALCESSFFAAHTFITMNIFCKNNQQTYEVAEGCTLEEVLHQSGLSFPYGVTSAKVNNKVEGLHYRLFMPKTIEFLDVTSSSGLRTYTRSLFFVLYKAVHDLLPGIRLRIETPVSNGYYCRIYGNGAVTETMVAQLRQRMEEIIRADLPFRRITVPTQEAEQLFREHGLEDKALLLETAGQLYATYYTLDGLPNYFYGSLLLRTSQLHLFGLEPYGEGLLLRQPNSEAPYELQPMSEQPKMFEVFSEQHHRQTILGVNTVGELNRAFENGEANDLIHVSEALQEKLISQLADHIASRPELRVILIAGPSSSGKTTFSKRLGVQLRASGVHPVPISLDDYFVDREKTPKDERGEYDFEHLEAVNIPLFNEQMNALLAGESVYLPRFNFHTGLSEVMPTPTRIAPRDLIILEGIHALNPSLTAQIPEATKFKIYASALTTLMLDDHNYIPTTDNRLLRRIVRDYKYRNYSAEQTILRWQSVRAGENKWIFPYQERADYMINTALLFELALLRVQALPLLERVPAKSDAYPEAYRLRKFLEYVQPISMDAVPPTSLLREFLGGSTFTY